METLEKLELRKLEGNFQDSLYKRFRKVENQECIGAQYQSVIFTIFGQFIDWEENGFGEAIHFEIPEQTGVYSLYVNNGILSLGSTEDALMNYEVFNYLNDLFEL